MEKKITSGMIVKSLKGHDTGRIYAVITVLNSDFCLVADGKKRKLDNPKLKRIKHLKIIEQINTFDTTKNAKDSDLVKIIKNFSGNKENA